MAIFSFIFKIETSSLKRWTAQHVQIMMVAMVTMETEMLDFDWLRKNGFVYKEIKWSCI